LFVRLWNDLRTFAHSGAKDFGDVVCRRNFDCHSVVGTCAGRRSGDQCTDSFGPTASAG